jgi:uncharacterized membrane protein
VQAGSPRGRRAYIDWARGLAVLLMIEWHSADAWTRAADRPSAAFSRALILGGFAAPLFLWLAGLGLALSAARLAPADGGRGAGVLRICRRGLEIFILGFLFRIQAFVVSPGSPAIMMFRVDILNVMGPAIVAAGLVWALGASRGALVSWYGAAAAAVALLTPIVRTAAIVDLLPMWFQWYLKPAGDLTNFTLFPWAGFVFAGAACGVILAAAGDKRAERGVQFAFAAAGLMLVALGVYLSRRPSVYRQSEFWTSSPTWFAIRLGVLMVAVAMLHAIGELAALWSLRWRSLERMGQSSLFVYWIHVELVYGYATWPLHGRLPLWGAVAAFACFSLLMYGAVVFRDRIVDNWRARSQSRPSAETAAV